MTERKSPVQGDRGRVVGASRCRRALIGLHEAPPEVATRTRSTLVTQDADMAEQLGRFFASLELLDALQLYVPIVSAHFELKPSRRAQFEKRALERRRSAARLSS